MTNSKVNYMLCCMSCDVSCYTQLGLVRWCHCLVLDGAVVSLCGVVMLVCGVR